jgi:hypothetical protein
MLFAGSYLFQLFRRQLHAFAPLARHALLRRFAPRIATPFRLALPL